MPSTSEPRNNESLYENPIINQAELQSKTQEVIDKCINMGLGKQVFEYERSAIVGVIIPEGLQEDKYHNLALIYCNDGSLVEVFVDNYTNKYIDTETMDFVVLPNNRDSHFVSQAVATAATIAQLGKLEEPRGGCKVVCDIDKEPEKIIKLLDDTVNRKREELNERLNKRAANQSKVNNILENI